MIEEKRRRGSGLLFASVAVGATGFVSSLTVAPLIGEDLSHSTTYSGIPWAMAVLGTGISSLLLSQQMARRGRAAGLVLGQSVGAVGGIVAVVAIASGSFVAFVVGLLLMGAGNAANQLSRYAGADLYPAHRRAAGLATIVWAGTIGGVAGPALLDPTGRVAVSASLPRLAGPMLLAVVGFALAVLFLLPLLRVLTVPPQDESSPASFAKFFDLWRSPRAQVALVALAAAQGVMVLIMAMTPLHLRASGHGLGSVGFVISAHVAGMYALSPISGRLADRYGPVRIVLVGFSVIVAAALGAAVAPEHSGAWLAIPLFGLGFGWSLSFVSGSALLTQGLAFADQARLQGATDSIVWIAAAAAGFGSGIFVGAFSYALLCVVGAVLVALPVVMISSRRRALAPVVPV